MSWSTSRNAGNAQSDEAKRRAKWFMRQAEQTSQQTVFLLNLLNEHRLEIEARDAVMSDSSKLVTRLQAENESLRQQVQELQQAMSATPGAASSASSAAQPARQRRDPRYAAGGDTEGNEGAVSRRPAVLASSAHAATHGFASSDGTRGGAAVGGDFEPCASPRKAISLLQEARSKLRMTSESSAAKEVQPEPLQAVPQLTSAASLSANEPLAPPTPQPSLRLTGPTTQAQEQVVRTAVDDCLISEAPGGPVSSGGVAGHALPLREAPTRPPPPAPQPAHKPHPHPQPQPKLQPSPTLQPQSSRRYGTEEHLRLEPPSVLISRGLQSQFQPLEAPQHEAAQLRVRQVPATAPQPPQQLMPTSSLQPQQQGGLAAPVAAVPSEQQQRLEARCKSLSAEVEVLRNQVASAQREATVATANYLTCKKDLEIMARKYDSLMLQKLDVEEQRDRLFCPQLDLSLVRQAMPVVDAALNDAEERLRTVVEMLASAQEDAEEAARMHFEQRRKWVEKLDELHAQLAEREARLAQLEALPVKT